MADQLTIEQIKEFKEAFSLFDKAENGIISLKDLGLLMRHLGTYYTEDELKENFDKFSNLQNFGFPEFLNMMAQLMKCDCDHTQEIPIEAFRVYDKDDSGLISISDLKKVLEGLGEKLTDAEFDEMIKETGVDIDGNDRVKYEEFIKRALKL